MAYTRARADWVDYTGNAGTDTLIRAVDLDTIEAGIEAATGVADGAVPKSLLTAKGDLIAATGSGAVARVGVGTDGQALVADSASSAGVKWATPAGGGGGVSFARAGTITYPSVGGVGDESLSAQATAFTLHPFYNPVPFTATGLGLSVWGTAAGSVARLGIYTVDASGNLVLLADSGALDASPPNGGWRIGSIAATTFPAAPMYIATCASITGPTLHVLGNHVPGPLYSWGLDSDRFGVGAIRVSPPGQTYGTGAMPATITMTNLSRLDANCPRVKFAGVTL